MDEQRSCASCGEHFAVNPRAGKAHQFCARPGCQRDRRRRNQQRRREEHGRSAPSPPSKRRRAAYMRAYRAARASYREQERAGRARRRAAAKQPRAAGPVDPASAAVTDPASAAVTEAGSTSAAPAKVYLVSGPTGRLRLHVVGDGGKVVVLDPSRPWGFRPPAVTEAG